MRRLREHQLVTVEVERPSGSIACLVLAIDGDEATLEPVNGNKLALVPVEGKDALLTFEFRSQLVTLRGRGRRDEADIRFAVTDRVTVPERRRYARVEVALPLTLTRAGGESIETRTRDLSADGLLAEEHLPASDEEWRVRLGLPEGGPLICEARVVRHVGGGTGMRYSSITPEDRERLKRFVADRKRAILGRLRSQAG